MVHSHVGTGNPAYFPINLFLKACFKTSQVYKYCMFAHENGDILFLKNGHIQKTSLYVMNPLICYILSEMHYYISYKLYTIIPL